MSVGRVRSSDRNPTFVSLASGYAPKEIPLGDASANPTYLKSDANGKPGDR